ncbi:MAG: peptidylprolyl isomerase [Segetibacter sp.]|nr:peptidylprolyl isomerase [Segetibacter sp.]
MCCRKLWLYLLCILVACSTRQYKNPHIKIQTRLGNIEIELYPDKAPKSVSAFLSYVDSGYYKNATFYRVLNLDNQPSGSYKAELIQGGLWRTNYTKSAKLKGIPHETTQQTGILHKDGVISLARQEPGTATTEFFICIGDQPGFDFGGENNPDKQGYAAFGKVVKGMDVVRSIYRQPEDDEAFDPPVDIYNIVRL